MSSDEEAGAAYWWAGGGERTYQIVVHVRPPHWQRKEKKIRRPNCHVLNAMRSEQLLMPDVAPKRKPQWVPRFQAVRTMREEQWAVQWKELWSDTELQVVQSKPDSVVFGHRRPNATSVSGPHNYTCTRSTP